MYVDIKGHIITKTPKFEEIKFNYIDKEYSGKMQLEISDEGGNVMPLFLWGECAYHAYENVLE